MTDPLDPLELFAIRRRLGRPRPAQTATVTVDPPQARLVGSSSQQDVLSLRLSLQVTPARSARLAAVYVHVQLDDPGAVAVRLDAERGSPVSVDGLGEPGFGWFLGDFGLRPGRGTPPDSAGKQQAGLQQIALTAEVRVLEDLPGVTGTVRVDASSWHGRVRPRLEHSTGEEQLPVEFALPGGLARQAGVRLCLAADIERFSRFPTPQAAVVQQQFDQIMNEARDRAGIDAATVALQRSGDGQATVFPAAINESKVIPLLITGLAEALKRVNATRQYDRIRIRTALDRGHLSRGVNGWIGNSIITVHRLLDSPAARQALHDHPQSDFVLIASDVVYRDIIAHGYGGLPAREFRSVLVDIPAKAFNEPAWVYAPEPERPH